ncbi:MAG: phosphatase PAP2 family protein [Calditrichaeota bacterium]|nr:MAG: PAP2 family protein [Calditrichota bacterium]MBL1205826.1 phosphatase PAP2 family protein [Calditrichota bacterium]NOG45653.1 phosphatase PAP2 family protein [Calditrichota bacterium]
MAIKTYLQLFLIMATIPLIAQAQTSTDNKTESSYFEYVKSTVVHDAKHIFGLGLSLVQSPLNYDKQDLHFALFSGASISAMFLVDPSLKKFALRNKSQLNDKIFEIDNHFNGRTGNWAALGLYFGGFIFKEEKVRMTGLRAAETLFIARSITNFLKYSFGRRRPYAGKNHMNFKLFRGGKSQYRSFPSGHTTSAFAFASIMAMSVDNTYWKVGWYGGATMVGFARIYHNVHWLSDTFFAGIISYSVASFVMNYNNSPKENNSVNFSISPGPNRITASIRF